MTKEIKRPDGTRYRINVSCYASSYASNRSDMNYTVSVEKCDPGKRKYNPIVNTDDYTWRRLSLEDRAKDNMRQALSVLTTDEINEALTDYWRSLIPTPENTSFR